jgi:hypothetical protein
VIDNWATGDVGIFFGNIIGAIGVRDVFSMLGEIDRARHDERRDLLRRRTGGGAAATEVPIAATRGVIRSVATLFVTSLLISLDGVSVGANWARGKTANGSGGSGAGRRRPDRPAWSFAVPRAARCGFRTSGTATRPGWTG